MMTTIWAGLALGAIYTIIALGYHIVFISSHTFNFAHAQLVMLGVFVAYWGLVRLKLPVVLVFLLAAAVVAAVAVFEERVAIRTLTTTEGQLITTVGFATLLDGVTQVVWGSEPLQVPFFGPSKVWDVFGGRVFPVELLLILVAIVVAVLIGLFGRQTLLGLAMLALSEDREAALMRGINVRALAIGAFAVSGAFAGLLGPVLGPKTFAVATLGSALALKGFVAMAIGGFGSAAGALVGGLSVGLIEALAGRYLGATYSTLMVFVVLLIVLMTRPTGLFGTVHERMV